MRKLLAIATLSLLTGIAACASEGEAPAAEPSPGETGTSVTGGSGTDGGPTDAGAGDDGGSGDDGGDAGGSGDQDGQGDGSGGDGENGRGDGESGGGDGDVLGTATAELPAGATDATPVPVRLEVVSLERLDGMVELRAVLTHEGRATAPDWQPGTAFDDPRLPADEGANSLSGAALVDAESQRAWLPMIDSEGACLCTGRLETVALAPGESIEVHADFGGVPDGLDNIEVQVPGFETIARVAIG